MNEIATCWIKHLTVGGLKVERLPSAVSIYELVQPCIEKIFVYNSQKQIICNYYLLDIVLSCIRNQTKSWGQPTVHKETL